MLAGIPILALLVASILKLTDLVAFTDSLTEWSLLPESAVKFFGLLIPNIELAIGLTWLCGIHRRCSSVLAAALLATFTLVFLAHAWLAEAPDCECFGRLLAHSEMVDDAIGLVPRNLALILMLVPHIVLGDPASTRAVAKPLNGAPLAKRVPSARRGFSIVELLVAIAIIAVVLSIAILTLGSAKSTARAITTKADLRTHAQTIAMYNADWDDAYPAFLDPKPEATRLNAPGFSIELYYFEASSSWNLALAERYYDSDYMSHLFFPKDWQPESEGRRIFTPIEYSCSFLAAPAYWEPSTRTGLDQWRGTRSSEVTYPPNKALLVYSPIQRDYITPNQVLEYQIAATDGAAHTKPRDELTAGYEKGDGAFNITGAYAGHATDNPRGLHTIDGLQGRDW